MFYMKIMNYEANIVWTISWIVYGIRHDIVGFICELHIVKVHTDSGSD